MAQKRRSAESDEHRKYIDALLGADPDKLDRLRAAINAVMESPTASLTTPATSVISTLQGLVSDFCNGEEEEAQLVSTLINEWAETNFPQDEQVAPERHVLSTPNGPLHFESAERGEAKYDLIDEGRNAQNKGTPELKRWVKKRLRRNADPEMLARVAELLKKSWKPPHAKKVGELKPDGQWVEYGPPLSPRRRMSRYWWKTLDRPTHYFLAILRLRILSRRIDLKRETSGRSKNKPMRNLEDAERDPANREAFESAALVCVPESESREEGEGLTALAALVESFESRRGVHLSSREREAYVRHCSGEKQTEIAASLGLAPSTVRVYLWRARSKLGLPSGVNDLPML